ncbi:hypothetical protein A4G19_05400 [Pasteurellaceae bacterium Macca]|nr:hypothetical protein [Pasteurellaceae bacterium Macca]
MMKRLIQTTALMILASLGVTACSSGGGGSSQPAKPATQVKATEKLQQQLDKATQNYQNAKVKNDALANENNANKQAKEKAEQDLAQAQMALNEAQKALGTANQAKNEALANAEKSEQAKATAERLAKQAKMAEQTAKEAEKLAKQKEAEANNIANKNATAKAEAEASAKLARQQAEQAKQELAKANQAKNEALANAEKSEKAKATAERLAQQAKIAEQTAKDAEKLAKQKEAEANKIANENAAAKAEAEKSAELARQQAEQAKQELAKANQAKNEALANAEKSEQAKFNAENRAEDAERRYNELYEKEQARLQAEKDRIQAEKEEKERLEAAKKEEDKRNRLIYVVNTENAATSAKLGYHDAIYTSGYRDFSKKISLKDYPISDKLQSILVAEDQIGTVFKNGKNVTEVTGQIDIGTLYFMNQEYSSYAAFKRELLESGSVAYDTKIVKNYMPTNIQESDIIKSALTATYQGKALIGNRDRNDEYTLEQKDFSLTADFGNGKVNGTIGDNIQLKSGNLYSDDVTLSFNGEAIKNTTDPITNNKYQTGIGYYSGSFAGPNAEEVVGYIDTHSNDNISFGGKRQ